MSIDRSGFIDIEFGLADAEKERAEAPSLLKQGFFDEAQSVRRAMTGREFLFLGYKGSGKTAIAARAQLLAEDEPTEFVSIEELRHFSYGDFKSATGGTTDFQARYPTTWAWLLLVELLQSLEHDLDGRAAAPAEYLDVVRALDELGLMPVPKLGQLVTTSAKRSFRIQLPRLLEVSHERTASEQDLQMRQVVNLLEAAVLHFRTRSRHVIFIDGLDEIITQRDLQYQSLAALLRAADRLNNCFRREGLAFKFCVLCRTDIFVNLPGANTNKIRQDSSETLDWYDDPRQPERTRLVRLVNLRATTQLRRPVDVFGEFLATCPGNNWGFRPA